MKPNIIQAKAAMEWATGWGSMMFRTPEERMYVIRSVKLWIKTGRWNGKENEAP